MTYGITVMCTPVGVLGCPFLGTGGGAERDVASQRIRAADVCRWADRWI
jgi:hypothetical protein